MICSFDIATKVITTFSYLDGVDETVISEGGAVTMGNGDLLFGTLDGYYLVDLKKLMASSGSLLKLQITDFLINGDVQSPRLNKTFDYYVPSRRSVDQYDIRTMEVIVPSLWLLSTPALIVYGLLLIGLALFIYYRIRSKAAK